MFYILYVNPYDTVQKEGFLVNDLGDQVLYRQPHPQETGSYICLIKALNYH